MSSAPTKNPSIGTSFPSPLISTQRSTQTKHQETFWLKTIRGYPVISIKTAHATVLSHLTLLAGQNPLILSAGSSGTAGSEQTASEGVDGNWPVDHVLRGETRLPIVITTPPGASGAKIFKTATRSMKTFFRTQPLRPECMRADGALKPATRLRKVMRKMAPETTLVNHLIMAEAYSFTTGAVFGFKIFEEEHIRETAKALYHT